MFCEEGGESITGKRASYNTMYGKECKLAVDDDKMRNLDMVPSGTKCAPNKVKLSQGDTLQEDYFFEYVGHFAQNQMFVLRFASTTNVWMCQPTGRGRTVQRSATTTG